MSRRCRSASPSVAVAVIRPFPGATSVQSTTPDMRAASLTIEPYGTGVHSRLARTRRASGTSYFSSGIRTSVGGVPRPRLGATLCRTTRGRRRSRRSSRSARPRPPCSVPSRRASPPDERPVEDADVQARLGQVCCGEETGGATADDRDVQHDGQYKGRLVTAKL